MDKAHGRTEMRLCSDREVREAEVSVWLEDERRSTGREGRGDRGLDERGCAGSSFIVELHKKWHGKVVEA